MKRGLLSVLAGLGLTLISVSVQAQFIVQVSNLTFSGGDPIYPITNDVTFNNLVLTETFADNSTSALTLFDSTHSATNTLDTGTIFLETDPLGLSGGARGAVKNLTLTGAFDLTNLDIATTFGAPTVNVNVNQTFLAALGLPSATGFVNIDAVATTGGGRFGAGVLALTSAGNGSVVPEPGEFAFAGACGIGIAATFARRRRINGG